MLLTMDIGNTQTVIGLFRKDKILISIVTIDRDAHLIPQLHQSILGLIAQYNIELLIVCRKGDINTQTKWKSLYSSVIIATVNNYDVKTRHNVDMIAVKRNIAIQYAIVRGYYYLFFLDSDIIIKHNTLDLLLEGCENHSDICLVPYFVRWLGYSSVCIYNPNSNNNSNNNKITIPIINLI